jgi:hypothetical protein
MSRDSNNPLKDDKVFFTKVQLEYLKEKFIPMSIVPGVTQDQIMYDSGKQYIISAIEKLKLK